MSNIKSRPLIRRHITLEDVLRVATPGELKVITNILLDKENDRLLGDDSLRQTLARRRAEGELYKAVSAIAFEIRSLGSISLASLLRRGEPVSYDEVVRDVANEMKLKFTKGDTTAGIEQKVLEMLGEKLAEQEARATSRPSLELGGFDFSWKTYALNAAKETLVGSLAATGLGAVIAGILKNKARPELQGLTMIVLHIARIRAGLVAADHEDFANRLRACL